jgi:hypothetical protein
MPFQLDRVQENSDGSRRGAAISITDQDTILGLTALDNLIVAHAVANSLSWFKKQLNELEVRARYKALVSEPREDGQHPITKFKVKCTKNPTILHRRNEDGTVTVNAGTIEDLESRGCLLVPIINVYGIWHMGGGSTFGLHIQANEIIVTPSPPPRPLMGFKSKTDIKFSNSFDEGVPAAPSPPSPPVPSLVLPMKAEKIPSDFEMNNRSSDDDNVTDKKRKHADAKP